MWPFSIVNIQLTQYIKAQFNALTLTLQGKYWFYPGLTDTSLRVIGLDPIDYGTHSLRRTKASLIYRRTKNLRAVQLLLGHTKLESTVRYLGIEVDDALEMAEQTEV